MRYYRAIVMAALAGVASAMPARAQARQNCQNETAQISVNFNGTERDVAAAKAAVDAKTAEVKALAEDQGFTKFEIQSHNININSNSNRNTNGDPMVQYNGNTSFTVVPADKAVDFMSLLVKRGYRVSVNINSYNNGSCSQS
jgi:uncharacterized protein YggE